VAGGGQRILIIGAGPCGLGAAWRLEELGHRDWLLLERETWPGGLAASFVDEAGFTWDLGGHVMFSHYDRFSEVVDGALAGESLEHEREAWIHVHGRFVPYPFQYNLHHLPTAVRDACLAGLRDAARRGGESGPSTRADEPVSSGRGPTNFGEWIDATFGTGIARHFMRPYNTKVWGRAPEELDWRWIGDRVAVPDVRRVEENVRRNRDDVSWGPNNTFRFPRHGGTGTIWRAVAAGLPDERLRLGAAAAAIDLDGRTCTTADGERLGYDQLISTMPLTELARIAGAAVPPLAATSVRVFGVGFEGHVPELLQTKCWMYFPDPECPFYRVTVFSNYSPRNVPDASRHWSLMLEVCVPGPEDEPALWDRTLASAAKAGLVPEGARIISRWSRFAPFAYPVPTLGRDAALAEVLPGLAAAGVLSRGRFGAWKYEVGNMDHSFMQGVEAVDRIFRGGEEPTLHHPEAVNA